ncbi:FabD/lysophospholipase-like protein [Fusarium austroafricanum]|uniref:FabD/lysophospholipase-like protein n=1 Tax=Fusarium austroafricanum TaxID=2364996 RepID=A0A8H4KQI2_9HYPO|nr:FabD/lysophospholipase-like protein [Fusarium austroafricanum]
MDEQESTNITRDLSAREASISKSSRICRRFLCILQSEEPYDPQIQGAITALRDIESALRVLRLYYHEYSNTDRWDREKERVFDTILANDFGILERLCNKIDDCDRRGERWKLSDHEGYQTLFGDLIPLQDQLNNHAEEIRSQDRFPAPDLTKSEHIKPHGVRLLSIDGGGVRGIVSLLVLQKIMESVRDHEIARDPSAGTHDRHPADYFDLAGGTSTGGLVCIMLFRLVRGKPRDHRALSNMLTLTAFLCTLRKHDNFAVRLRSYHIFDGSLPEYHYSTIWQAARATSAAPFYFPEANIGRSKFWDGGLANNNPVDEVWAEKSLLFQKRAVKCVISLGTAFSRGGRLLTNLTNVENVHRRFEDMMRAESIEYFRFDPSTLKDDIGMSDYGQIETLKHHTNEYLGQPPIRALIDICAQLLCYEKEIEVTG